ncbi:ATP-binding protein [uncultured Desulfosarcina sp.]|uniref:sensor histidine kinase n=1 Tax=uncultured Desulfosarcina sp. TaxID=218289 RepID=UPI0029C796F9|nr:ATP-binding protein [uncultured Desulfosarcina sp.]
MTMLYEHIETDAFDREYGLEDLLPQALAKELLEEIDGCSEAAIILPDGDVYFGRCAVGCDFSECICQVPDDRTVPSMAGTGHGRAMLFPLIHELETIGYLALETVEPPPAEKYSRLALGRFVARSLNRIINLNYRNRMTAGLHGQVVADSYENLKKKAAALALSEEKYRHLAENLEIEVEKKSREIQAAQLHMLQQEKMASIGQLAAGMAHELNNPVGFVISNLNTLKAGTTDLAALIGKYRQLTALLTGTSTDGLKARQIGELLSAIDRFIDDIDLDFVLSDTGDLIDESLDGAKRVKIIVQNLRDFTHPSIDTTESAAINDCLDTTLAILSSHVMPDVTVTRQYGELPLVTCHLREINQVFFNILKNAFQAVGYQGEITIETVSDGDAVMVRVSDTGPGIEKSHLERIFDPFFTTREVGGGTGLGLFQAYSTVKTHGGTIAVDSTRGKGSTFSVRLPIAPCGQADDKNRNLDRKSST